MSITQFVRIVPSPALRLLIVAVLLLEALVAQTSHAADAPRTFGEEVSKQSEIYNSVGQKVP
jgi:hypothetical protein